MKTETKSNSSTSVLPPEAIFLIGYPGCGKSTWIASFNAALGEGRYTVLSSDDLIYELAKKDGIDYTAAHAKYYETIIPEMKARMTRAVMAGNNIIIDQTNLDPVIRAEKLAMIPSQYRKTAILFEVPMETILARQNSPERLAIGKVIPDDVFLNMQAVYRKPDLNEFDEIVTLTV